MGTFNAKRNLLLLCIYMILITTPMVAVPPQELYGEPSQTYAILCIISFFIGTMLYVLIHKCCIYQPTPSSIPPVDRESMEKELMEKLQTMVQKSQDDKDK